MTDTPNIPHITIPDQVPLEAQPQEHVKVVYLGVTPPQSLSSHSALPHEPNVDQLLSLKEPLPIQLHIDTAIDHKHEPEIEISTIVHHSVTSVSEVAVEVKHVEDPIESLSFFAKQVVIEVRQGQWIKTVKSAYDVITYLMKIVQTFKAQNKPLKGKEKLKIVLEVVEFIAKGADGIAGTSDDLFDGGIVMQAKLLIDNNLVGGFIENALMLSSSSTLCKMPWWLCC